MVRNAIRAAEQVDNDFRALLTNVGTARTAPAYRARGTHALSKAEEAAFAKMTPQQRADYFVITTLTLSVMLTVLRHGRETARIAVGYQSSNKRQRRRKLNSSET